MAPGSTVSSLPSTIPKNTYLPALDRLEGFDPHGPSPYRRVLIPVETTGGAGVLAWAYVTAGSSGTHLPGWRWPPGAGAD